MTITAKIIADSISKQDIRLTTMELRYPRFIHAEFMTHRMFSRNASSSRAIPVKRIIQQVMEDPAVPMHWGKNQPGMQAKEECEELVDLRGFMLGGDPMGRTTAWLVGRDNAVKLAKAFDNAGYHKQIVNRLLEPWMHIKVVVTATEWVNFFELRDHPDAQPEMQYLAKAMKNVMDVSMPHHMFAGEYHLPYVTSREKEAYSEEACIRASAARCARTSYDNHDGTPPDIYKDIDLYLKLVGARPWHASPVEHQATPQNDRQFYYNLHGWMSHRYEFEKGAPDSLG